MATVTQDQLGEFAYTAALNNEESDSCPTSYLGYIIPKEFPNGEESDEVWAMAYNEGLGDRGFYASQGAEDRERDWQD